MYTPLQAGQGRVPERLAPVVLASRPAPEGTGGIYREQILPHRGNFLKEKTYTSVYSFQSRKAHNAADNPRAHTTNMRDLLPASRVDPLVRPAQRGGMKLPTSQPAASSRF